MCSDVTLSHIGPSSLCATAILAKKMICNKHKPPRTSSNAPESSTIHNMQCKSDSNKVETISTLTSLDWKTCTQWNNPSFTRRCPGMDSNFNNDKETTSRKLAQFTTQKAN
eukprot:c23687_g1_i2 orf=799-1131(-)